LADEPTGAIDSETSIQIMNILKDISKDRLVIMVTHNPELANTFSTRIIRLLDGKVIGDTNPYHTEDPDESSDKKKKPKKIKQQMTSMSFITAFALSMKNLLTKKGRTILTAFAGSIGIIGIALVLALSNGFTNYINKMQTDTLSAYPLTIASSTTDWTSLMNMNRRTELAEYPEGHVIYINKLSEMVEGLRIKNDLTDEYINTVIKNIDPSLYNSITYEYGINMNIYKLMADSTYRKLSSGSWSLLAENENAENPYAFLVSQYDVLEGNLPKSMDEAVIVVNTYNQINDMTLQSLGISFDENTESIAFSDIIGETYTIIANNALYTKDTNIPERFLTNPITPELYNAESSDVIHLKIVGIVRTNRDTDLGSITGTVGYTKALTDYLFERSLNSEIVKWMNEEGHENIDPLSGIPYMQIGQRTPEQLRYDQMITLGGLKKPNEIRIYPVDFNAKETIKAELDEYNETKNREAIEKYYRDLGISEATATTEQKKQAQRLGKAAGVFYTDLMTVLVTSMNTLVNAISIVLIVFTSISLVVSSIMIGIITYISVLERTKEIGVLRSIGARKKDISRVFNAETIMIGLAAGVIGISVTLLLMIPINIILEKLVEINGLASINPIHAVILIFISIFLTFISGLIPSRLAAKRDPVIALRTE
jgi:putative ABC transport system permease protein